MLAEAPPTSPPAAPPAADDRLFLGMEIEWLWAGPDPPRMSSHVPTYRDRNIATHRIVGVRRSGKSALLENIMFNYVDTGSCAYDFFSANDNESLAALESPKKDQVVLVHDDEMKIRSNFDSIAMGKLDPTKTEDGKIFVTCKRFYPTEYRMYAALYNFTEAIKNRDSWNRADVIAIRESQEYLNSRQETEQDKTKSQAEGSFIKFHNQAVHSGYGVVLDQQRDVEVVKNLRENATFTYYKKLGGMEIPSNIHWIMSSERANFSLDALRVLDEDQFLLVTDDNAVGAGSFEYPPWHIKRGSGLLAKLDIHPIRIVQGKEVEVEIPKPLPPKILKASKYVKVAQRGLVDKRVVITPAWEKRIEDLQASGTKAGKIYETLVAEGFSGKMRTLEGKLKEIRTRAAAGPVASS